MFIPVLLKHNSQDGAGARAVNREAKCFLGQLQNIVDGGRAIPSYTTGVFMRNLEPHLLPVVDL